MLIQKQQLNVGHFADRIKHHWLSDHKLEFERAAYGLETWKVLLIPSPPFSSPPLVAEMFQLALVSDVLLVAGIPGSRVSSDIEVISGCKVPEVSCTSSLPPFFQ